MENQNQSPKAQLIERLKQANNVLVTVSKNPSVDQLSAAIGLTLMLNQIDKHATAVFSGDVPNTLEFLKPEETLEKNTDSLRDFIISLDKEKADKLRYKVEDKWVKIFITPYKTSLSEADLVFGQGDFNVDVVVAIGVHQKEDLDDAITSHGRILHDATVATVNTTMSGQLGSINWVDAKASSLSEMLVPVCESLKAEALDNQMATAFLTGIVAETARFSNEKTSSDTMNISAKLMAAGANQQLVATQLEQKPAEAEPKEKTEVDLAEEAVEDALKSDGSLAITHDPEPEPEQKSEESEPTPEEQVEELLKNKDLPEVQAEQEPLPQQPEQPVEEETEKPSRLILEPPTLGGKLTANAEPEALDPSIDPLSPRPMDSPLLSHDKEETPKPADDSLKLAPAEEETAQSEPDSEAPAAEPDKELTLPPLETDPEPVEQPESAPEPEEIVDTQTLTDLEAAVDSPHMADVESEAPKTEEPTVPDADAALAAAHQAFDAVAADAPEIPAAFNASGPMEVPHNEVPDEAPASQPPQAEEPAEPAAVQIDPVTGMLTYPTNLVPPSQELPADPTASNTNEPAAPPVPPPMPMPPLRPPSGPQLDPNNLPPVN